MSTSEPSSDNNTPWYKQFWPWFLIIVPLSSMVFSLNYAKLAVTTQNDLVIDEYYKEGRGINTRLDKFERALQLGIDTRMTIKENAVAIEFVKGAPEQGDALKLNFYHVTIAARDFTLLLTRDANGIYRASHDVPIEGKWRVSLLPQDDEWKLQKTLQLPYPGPITFAPEF